MNLMNNYKCKNDTTGNLWIFRPGSFNFWLCVYSYFLFRLFLIYRPYVFHSPFKGRRGPILSPKRRDFNLTCTLSTANKVGSKIISNVT